MKRKIRRWNWLQDKVMKYEKELVMLQVLVKMSKKFLGENEFHYRNVHLNQFSLSQF